MTPATARAGTPPAGGAPSGPARSPSPEQQPSPGLSRACAVADAVLWEGYLLYPYRRSSGKNRVRWQFGVLAPRPWLEARGPVVPTVAGSADAWRQRTECLLEAPDDARVSVRVRFLQVQHRAVQRRAGGTGSATNGGWVPVDALEDGGRRWLTFDEAVAREVRADFSVAQLRGGCELPLTTDGGVEVEVLPGGSGRLVRSRAPLRGTVRVAVERVPAPFRLDRLRVLVANGCEDVPTALPREEVVRRSLVAAHCVLAVEGGAFVSLLDPPEWAAQAARDCTNEHTFPVLAGPPGTRDVVLSAPIILYDHPRIAPESPGELFDSGEIDEILSLRTLTLTDREKREARATDPRAAALVDRVEALPEQEWARLHGAVRSLRPLAPENALAPGSAVGPGPPAGPAPDAAAPGAPPWWDPGADASVSPETDAVVVDGVRVARGSRVRLRPRLHGTDPQDRFLDGRTARVAAVFLDVDDTRHVAVTLDDDPESDLLGGTGRYRYFAPEEIRPLDGELPP